MRSHELTLGRTFGVAFDHGEDFFAALGDFCGAHEVRQGYATGFIAGFSRARIVGTCEDVEDSAAPVWDTVELVNVEALGAGTLAYDSAAGRVAPHIHATVGEKGRGATGFTSHLVEATVQFLTEMLIIEVAEPELRRVPRSDLYDVPLLRFAV